MGWSELRRVPDEYNDVVKQIDEQVLKLITKRKSLVNGTRFVPPRELIQEWSRAFQMEPSEIGMFIHTLNHGARPQFPDEKGGLLGVVPIMKKAKDENCEYVITHAMQHEKASVVAVEIHYHKADDGGSIHIKPHLMLEVEGNRMYSTHHDGARGGGTDAQLSFLVTPGLPEDISDIHFSLVPHVHPFQHKEKEIVLDQQVDFET
ncbi:MAG TPA: hypothetical protein VFT51_12125 [Bacillales bacterium]|nr:hypothetical protein [Bacillales bacterium]